MKEKEKKTVLNITQNCERLDHCIKENCPELGRREIKGLCQKGMIFVNGRKAQPGMPLTSGDCIEFYHDRTGKAARPNFSGAANFPLKVLYEDESMLVIDKPRMIHSVSLHPKGPLTLADIIAAKYPECLDASPDLRESGLIQRLDYETSGLIIAGKTKKSWSKLHQQLKEGKIRKSYLALSEGEIAFSGLKKIEIDFPLVIRKNSKKASVVSEMVLEKDCQEAHSAVRVLGEQLINGKHFFLLEVSGRAFKRHQVRAHLACVGLTLVGDILYGSKLCLKDLGKIISEDGFFLHAWKSSCHHPITGEVLRFKSEPALLKKLWNA